MPTPQREPVVSQATVRGGDGLIDRNSPTGVGGWDDIVNQNEMAITKRTVESVPVEYAPMAYNEQRGRTVT